MFIEIGKAYKKFACGCITYASTEPFRKHNPYEKTPYGNYKKSVVCPTCKTLDAAYQYRFKICPVCFNLKWTRQGNLTDGRCQDCGLEIYNAAREPGVKAKPKKALQYFQHGELIPKPPGGLVQETMCAHRRWCLPDTGRLHCGGCDYFEPEIFDR